MILKMMSLLMIAFDVGSEVTDKVSSLFASNENMFIDKLRVLGVNPDKIYMLNSNMRVTDWSNVLGVIKKGDRIFAYSKSIKDEMDANLILAS